MLTALSSAVSGLDAYQEQMDIIGNNIANLNTTGFKSATGNLVDAFSDTLLAATSSAAGIQVGTGVATASVTNDWSEGAINPTGVASNLAISGNAFCNGFFIVQDPVTGSQYFTQDGTFNRNSLGNLVTATGENVMGLTAGGTAGAIVINPGTLPDGATMSSYTINPQGVVTANMSDGTTVACGQLQLQNFTNLQALTNMGSNLYSNVGNAAGALTAGTPGTGSLGTITSGALELSNVDLSAQMADLIVAQRAFEANSKIITTSDELLQDVVNMKR
jgi:flagellar hook protein FlgE